MANYFFTSESVSEGHPDKMCDQISDAILDECFRQDKFSRVACETAVGGQHGEGFAMVFGEITTNANLDYTKIIKDTVKNIGYTKDEYGYTPDSIKILNNKNEYFVVTWVFTYDECEISEGLCWQTIGVSPPMYFESGI